MAHSRPIHGWEDKKRPMSRNDMSISKRPRLDVRVVSSSKASASPLKKESPTKSFKRTTSLPSTSRDSPSPTDEILLSAARATEEEEAKIARELQGIFVTSTEAKDSIKIKPPSTSIAISNVLAGNSKAPETQPTGNNGSSGFDKLFSDEINEDFVEQCMNLATALSQQPRDSPPSAPSGTQTPVMSQAYEFFFQGVGESHSTVLEKTMLQPPVSKPSTFRPPVASSTANRLNVNQNKQLFCKPPPPAPLRPQNASTSEKMKEQESRMYPPGAEAEIRRLELEVERLSTEKKQIKEAQNTKDGEAAVLRFQVNQSQNQMKQLKATQSQALSAMNAQYQEKLKELQKENEHLKSQLQVQVMENNAVRERSKLLESNNSRIRLIEPQVTSPLNSSVVKSQKYRRESSFLNRSTFEEDVRSPPKPSKSSPSNGPQEPSTNSALDVQKVEPSGLWYHLGVSERNVGCSLALRLAGWERIEADDSDDSCSTKKIEYDQDSSLDLLKIGPVRVKRRTRVFNEEDRPGLAACLNPLRTICLWPESNLDSPAAQSLLRKIAIECCGLVHYKFVLLKDHEIDLDEKILHERDCDIIERGGDILDMTAEVDLLDDRPWYKGERGISSRRAFGLLSELALVSSSISALLTGSQTSQHSPLERHRFTKLPDFADDCSPPKPTKNDNQQPPERMETGEASEAKSVEDNSWNQPDRYWFLEVSAELCLTIVRQKRTNQFNGVFVGLLTLLRNCAQNGEIVGEARTVVLRIIRGILLARPSFYTLRCVLHLLEQLSDGEDLMTSLCTYNDHDDYQEDLNHGLYYFRSDSCLLQLLCAQLNSAGKNRWHLADPMVRWLLAVFAHTTIPPRWLVPHTRQDAKDTVDYGHLVCCPRVISTAVTLIYEAFQSLKGHFEREDLMSPWEESERWDLAPKVMQRALILLHTLAVNDLSEYMGRVEGDYDVLIPGLNRIRQHLNLAPVHEKLLIDLVRLEESDDPHLNLTESCEVDPGAEDVMSEHVWYDSVQSVVLP